MSSPETVLVGAAADTHRGLAAAAKDVERLTRELQAAQETFRRAMAEHLSAITGSNVAP